MPRKGHIQTAEHKRHSGEAQEERYQKKEERRKTGEAIKKAYTIMSDKTRILMKKNRSEAIKEWYKQNPGIRSGEKALFYGHKHTEESKRKMRESFPNRFGENHWNWQGGKSFESYGMEFSDELKLSIRQRDNFVCQFCGIQENGRAHDCHHIDYDKENNDKLNLILLCQDHNKEANYGREEWQFLFETLQEIRL